MCWSTSPASARAQPTDPEAALEVEVVGERSEPGTQTLSAREVRELPGAFGDPFRAIESLSGVTPVLSGVPYFFLRGAPPANVGYFLDGVRVPLLFHVGFGPGVIAPALVERVELFPAAYPARFGRFAGGIVAAELSPPSPVLRAETSLRLFDSGALVEVPFDRGRGAAMGAYRYSTTGALVSLLSPEITLEYWDYQARAVYRTSASDEVSLFAFGSHDKLTEEEADVGEVETVLDADFHRVDLRYDRALGERGGSRTAVTLGFDRSATSRGEHRAEAWSARVRNQQTLALGRSLTLRLGADALLERFDTAIGEDEVAPDATDLALRALLTSRVDLTAGAYAELGIEIPGGLELSPGLRVDGYLSQGEAALAVDPRLAARARIDRRLHFLCTVGMASQPASYLGAVPGLSPGGLAGGLQRSLLSSAGAELSLPERVEVAVTAFRNAFFEMADALGNRAPGADFGVEEAALVRSQGESVGLELMLRRPFSERVGGILSYTLSRSRRTLGGESFDHPYDRRHVLSAALSFHLGRSWRLGQRTIFSSGAPVSVDYRTSVGDLPRLSPDATAEEVQRELMRVARERAALRRSVEALDLGARLPPFLRLDLRLSKGWRVGRYGLTFVAEVQNLLGARERLGFECRAESGCEPSVLGPIVIPSVGLEGTLGE